MITNEQIKTISSLIAAKFPVKDIFLFGSLAQGDANNDSDLDLCLTTRLGNSRKIDMLRAIRKEISHLVNIPLDILIYDIDEFQSRAVHKNTLEYKILNQGILLNG